jgi:hypothetical protein
MNKNLSKVIAIAFLFLAFAFAHSAHAAVHNVSGKAFSSNIGWINMSCDTDPAGCTAANGSYGVDMDPNTGNLSGSAWSSSIGWIGFVSSGCPSGSCSAKYSSTTGDLTGWMQTCGGKIASGAQSTDVNNSCTGTPRTDGSDMWISLSTQSGESVTYGAKFSTTNGAGSGQAWGSDVIGWIDWSGVTLTLTPINGACGTANGQPATTAPSTPAALCSQGTPTAVTGTAPGPWTWSCTGVNGGTSSSTCATTVSTTATIDLTINSTLSSITIAPNTPFNIDWKTIGVTTCPTSSSPTVAAWDSSTKSCAAPFPNGSQPFSSGLSTPGTYTFTMTDGASVSDSVTVIISPGAPSVTLFANGQSGTSTVSSGTTINLTWTGSSLLSGAQGNTNCTFSGSGTPSGGTIGGNVAYPYNFTAGYPNGLFHGPLTNPPLTSYTYNIWCLGSDGTTHSNTSTAIVNISSAPSVTLTVDQSSFASGPATPNLSWTSSGVSSCKSVSNPSSTWNSSNRGLSGSSLPVTINNSTTFGISCDNGAAIAQVSVTIGGVTPPANPAPKGPKKWYEF